MAKTENRAGGNGAEDTQSGGHGLAGSLSARTLLVLAAAGAGLYLCYRLALPFLPALTWAVVLGITMMPLHRRVEARVHNPNLAAGISVGAAAIAVVVPLLLVAQQLVREAANGAVHLGRLVEAARWREAISTYPWATGLVDWIDRRLDPAGLADSLAQWLTDQSGLLLQGSLNQALNLVLTFYLLFYFLRDRRVAVNKATELSPLDAVEARVVVDRFVETVHATIFGTVAVAAVQGALGGLMFWWLDLPTPVFWGLVMGLLAILPVLGASIVWFPAALILAVDGEWVKALVLAIWGALVIATIDNLLFPILIGNRLRLHTVIAFIAAVGGIVVFGAAGLVLGPATVAVTLTLVEILKRRFDGAAARR